MTYNQPAGGQMGPQWGAQQPTYPPPFQQPPAAPQPSGAPAIIGFILSLIAFFCGLIPFLGLFLGISALALSLWAVTRRVLRGLAIAGIVLSTLASLTSLATTGITVLGLISSSPETSSSASPDPTYAPEDFATVDDRTLASIAKDPDSHAGETLQLYGWVSQFDPTSGKCTMRVSVSAEQRSSWMEYEHNSLAYSGDGDDECPALDDVLEDDEVRMNVVLDGEKTYNSFGGGTTVPYFEVIDIEVL